MPTAQAASNCGAQTNRGKSAGQSKGVRENRMRHSEHYAGRQIYASLNPNLDLDNRILGASRTSSKQAPEKRFALEFPGILGNY